MCLRKASIISVYINIIYICYSVYRSRGILQITIIEINTLCNGFVNEFINGLLTGY